MTRGFETVHFRGWATLTGSITRVCLLSIDQNNRGRAPSRVLRPVLRTVVDARDFNGVLFDLVDGDVGRKDQFAPPVHASEAAAVRKVLLCPAALIDGFHGFTSGSGIVLLDAPEYLLKVFGGECRLPDFHRHQGWTSRSSRWPTWSWVRYSPRSKAASPSLTASIKRASSAR
jgi:hypothetical protein